MVAGVSILVSIYNSVVARKKEIAILRALGATRLRIVTLLCVEAGIIGLAGAICPSTQMRWRGVKITVVCRTG